MKYLMMNVAAVALAASGALAQGNGNGNGKGKGPGGERGGPPASMQQKGPKAAPGQGRGNGAAKQKARQNDRGPDMRRGGPDVRRGGPSAAQSRGRGQANRPANANDYRSGDVLRDATGRIVDRRLAGDGNRAGRGLIEGCPPGLAKKYNGCMPPGQAKKQNNPFAARYGAGLFGLGDYGDNRYRFNDGYLLRYDGANRISGYLPLLGGALSVGNTWPSSYGTNSIPEYMIDYYSLGQPGAYRYADNTIYRLDPETSAIRSIAALLTGSDFVVGEPMPRGYDVYNVPRTYRGQYVDGPNAMYRYSDGYVYRMDPETRIVAAAIDLLT